MILSPLLLPPSIVDSVRRKTRTEVGAVPICMVMARKSSLFHSSERFVALEEVLKWLEEVLKWLEEVSNLPPNFSPFLLNT